MEMQDKEVRGFASWSALLLHMITHKAYYILYRPLFRNATNATEIPVKERIVFQVNFEIFGV
jgi:hypothetical protein